MTFKALLKRTTQAKKNSYKIMAQYATNKSMNQLQNRFLYADKKVTITLCYFLKFVNSFNVGFIVFKMLRHIILCYV